MAAALLEHPPTPSLPAKHMQSGSCPSCGVDWEVQREAAAAQRRIQELEAQVEMLTEKATAAGTYQP